MSSFYRILLGAILALSVAAFGKYGSAWAQDALCADPIETTVGTFTSKADIAASMGGVCVDPEPSNTPPFINNPGNQTSNEDDAVSLQLIGGDAEDLIAWSEVGLPPNLSLNQSGLVTGITPAEGSYTVTVTVDDGEATDSTTFGWTVLADTPPPVGGAVTLEWDVTSYAAVNGSTKASLFSLVSIDVDNDGDPDILGGDHSAANHILLTNQAFSGFSTTFFGNGRCSLSAWNANGDWACRDNDLADWVWFTDDFSSTQNACGNGPNIIGFADFNNDGDVDCVNANGEVWDYTPMPASIVAGVPANGQGVVNFPSGLTVVAPADIGGSAGMPGFAVGADFDNDGQDEFFQVTAADVPTFFEDGFVVAQTLPGNDWDAFYTHYGNTSVCDFDNDGDLDLLITKDGNTAYRIYRNDLNWNFVAIPSIPEFANSGNGWGTGRYQSTCGDYNGDGIDDFAFIAKTGSGNSAVDVRVAINKGIAQ